MPWQDHIVVDLAICHGKVCDRDTPTMVAVILGNPAAGLCIDEILCSYPPLSREAVQATIAYAAGLVHERVRWT
jgi:uncharacterized protein (DUF433 family)